MKTAAGIEADRRQGTALVFGKAVKVDQHLEDGKPERLRTVIPFTVKSLNDEERTIQFVGSSDAVDRYGDVVEQNWELGNFIKNPVVPWGHDYSMPPVAKALEVGYTNGNLTFTAQFADADTYPWADTIYKLYKGGYLRAFSVGFIPLEFDGDWSEGYTFTKCELLEVSCVTVPANPEALVLAFKEGVLSDAERKTMVANAQKVIKTLTDDTEGAQNEDMETAKALKELTGVMTEVRDLLAALKDTSETDEPQPDPTSDNPEDEPSGGAEGETEDEPEGIDLKDNPAVQDAIKQGVKSAFNQITGKIE